MDQTQIQQEHEYEFPYHHMVHLEPFSQDVNLLWGFRYVAYLEKVIEEIGSRPCSSVIDIGCGDGKLSLEMKKRYPAKRIVGVDYSEKALSFARAFAPDVEFAREKDEQFDAFVMVEVLEHIHPDEMDSFLKSVHNNLCDGGFGVITTPHVNAQRNLKHYQHFTKESIQKTLDPYFAVVYFEYMSKTTWLVRMIQRALVNRLFSLRYPPLVSFLYRLYQKHGLPATENTAMQVFVVVTKK
jgi:ubiquinone/menaquinone biosynthesis C-methylase UbiE